MTSSEIRQSFLDFFKSKQHTIVPSSSLMPDSPNLLFTNAGMNQFVPIFLGQVKCPYNPPRAADTQKCIRAGGKHNDLDDVGLDTYHHTFFEMLGNWSFGDYFKKEAIEWAWELVIEKWKFPANRLYVTVFCPYSDNARWQRELEEIVKVAKVAIEGGQAGLGGTGNPAEALEWADDESTFQWAVLFLKARLDPMVHIVPGSKKDNFWMMGETGPCGPCSELHVDLTPAGDTKGALVNKGDPRTIEIWNLVFIQFNANPDGTFSPLPAKHVDTGMGFERATSIIQCTKNFTDFTGIISNYETDIFRLIFDALEKLSGKKYTSTLPPVDLSTINPQQSTDIAFRVIADHIRTLSFAIADGIQPGNTDRNYVLRRILRRAVRYGRTLGFHEPFFYKLVDVLADTMGDVFPEIGAKKKHVQDVIRMEEEAFNKTLDRGIVIFENEAFANAIALAASKENYQSYKIGTTGVVTIFGDENLLTGEFEFKREGKRVAKFTQDQLLGGAWRQVIKSTPVIFGHDAFKLYDTYGFPLDLTELMARERGLIVDKEGFEKLMEEQRARARAAQKREIISLSQIETDAPTRFIGFDNLNTSAQVLEIVSIKEKPVIILDASSFYAEMGGQVGDTGQLNFEGRNFPITNTQKTGNVWLHFVEPQGALSDDLIMAEYKAGNIPSKLEAHSSLGFFPEVGARVEVSVNKERRNAIQRHHTVTHLLHWALHEVVSKEASQKGSFVGPDKLTFDFNSAALTPQQIADVEKLVNERILENAGVSWIEVPYADVKSRKDVMQFFGDKYGDTVRVVQIGGHAGKLDGYSMELCGGTHTRATGEIGLFRIVGESAVAAGVRRIEAVAGLQAYQKTKHDAELIGSVAGKINAPVAELEKKIDALLTQQKELEKSLRAAKQKEAAADAKTLLAQAQTINGIPAIIANISSADGDTLQTIADALKSQFKGVIVLGSATNGAVSFVAAVSPDFTAKVQAGKIIQTIAPIVGGKGGGKPDNARGGGKDTAKLDEALAKAKTLLG